MAACVRALGVGSALPARKVSNDDLAQSKSIDTTDEWIRQRTGIAARYFAEEGETTVSLAVDAARKALAAADLQPADLDLIIVATTTPDHTFPAAATEVQSALGIGGTIAFDVQAVCSGFIYALTVADSMLRSGAARTALVIGADTMSRLLDFTDRGTCVLFGDGAGALILQRDDSAAADLSTQPGILAHSLHADGTYRDMLFVDGGASTTGTIGHLRMQGREVFKHAVVNMAAVVHEVLGRAGLSADDVSWVIPHQANLRILTATAEKLGLPAERVVATVKDHGNTSAASVPLALDVAVQDGRVQRGDLLVLEAMGGGFTWGAVLLRW